MSVLLVIAPAKGKTQARRPGRAALRISCKRRDGALATARALARKAAVFCRVREKTAMFTVSNNRRSPSTRAKRHHLNLQGDAMCRMNQNRRFRAAGTSSQKCTSRSPPVSVRIADSMSLQDPPFQKVSGQKLIISSSEQPAKAIMRHFELSLSNGNESSSAVGKRQAYG